MKREEVLLDAALAAVFTVHLCLAPFTKVEESFNMQAAHDFLFHGFDLARYDHHTFPGVVPRTFLGALVLATLAAPVSLVTRFLGFPKLASQYAVRLVLGMLVAAAMGTLRREVSKRYGRAAGVLFVAVSAAQFHLPFYATRTLPNTFALVLVTAALAFWLQGRLRAMVCTLVVATAVFRSDVAVFAVPLLAQPLLLRRDARTVFPRAVLWALVAFVASLAATVPLDSLLWRRWLWPEGIVLYYNTVLNKSSLWGTHPWHWYFTSALPRAMGPTLLLVVVGVATEWRRTLREVLPCVAFIALYSFLPHKELRFIIYALPLLNVVAAAGAARCFRVKGIRGKLLALGCIALLCSTAAMTAVLTAASHKNYPGGEALLRLHRHNIHEPGPFRVHIGNAAAQSGVTRFLESTDPRWSYDKTEHLTADDLYRRGYTLLLSENATVPGFVRLV